MATEPFPVRRRFWSYLRLGYDEPEALRLTARDMGIPEEEGRTWTYRELALYGWLRWMRQTARM